MEETLGSKIKKTAGMVSKGIADTVETLRITKRIADLQREKTQVRETITDLLLRMLDRNTFVEALLRPDYLRLKAIEAELAKLEAERAVLVAEDKPAETGDEG